MTELACTDNTTSSREVVVAPLNPDSICSGFCRADGRILIYLQADICKKSIELPGSIKTFLTSNPLIPSVRIRACSCGCRTRLAFIRVKVIVSSTGRTPPIRQVMLDEAYLLHYEGYVEQSLFFPFGIVFFINGTFMNVVDNNSRSCWSCGDLDDQILGCFPLFIDRANVLF